MNKCNIYTHKYTPSLSSPFSSFSPSPPSLRSSGRLGGAKLELNLDCLGEGCLTTCTTGGWLDTTSWITGNKQPQITKGEKSLRVCAVFIERYYGTYIGRR